ncbi:TlpA disulfide reductase family protein [uncultured Arcticibacterium sp.]|uniref:TlpA family protein disulfide reductase n=1 Tax=uncultured Arcticibacterium sp. TaxID=2173042 RepID=UPI0030F80892
MQKTLILSVLFLISFHAIAQKKISVEFNFSNEFSISKLQYALDDGNETYKAIKPEIEGSKLIFTGNFTSQYATIWLYYPTNKETKHYYSAFWLGEKPASISIEKTDPTFHSPLVAKSLINAFEVSNEGGRALDAFTSTESTDHENFFKEHGNAYKKNDSLARIFYEKYAALSKKQIEYIEKNPTDYFSIWYFNKNIAVSPALSRDSLISYAQKIFKDSPYKFERERSLSLIKNTPILKNTLAPNFEVNDINATKISSVELRGKSILLVYWASWCLPCIAEIPTLKRIREMFSIEQLEIISITKDETYPPYQRALDKYNMDWKHVYGSQEIIDMFNVTGIPQIFLIDKNGYVKYSQYGYEESKSEGLINIVKKTVEE